MKTLFLIALVLAVYKTAVLSKHHLEDHNIPALIGDAVSCLIFIVVFVLMYFFF